MDIGTYLEKYEPEFYAFVKVNEPIDFNDFSFYFCEFGFFNMNELLDMSTDKYDDFYKLVASADELYFQDQLVSEDVGNFFRLIFIMLLKEACH